MRTPWTIVALLFLFFVEVSAHNSKEAFFAVQFYEKYIEVEAEFPWTLRNALIDFAPELNNATHKQQFRAVFESYVKANFLVYDNDKKPLELNRIKTVQANGHSHQINYIFEFKGRSVTEIKNTMLFNISEKQRNYHTILLHGKKRKYLSSFSNPSFLIQQQKTVNFFELLLVLSFILTAVLYTFDKYS